MSESARDRLRRILIQGGQPKRQPHPLNPPRTAARIEPTQLSQPTRPVAPHTVVPPTQPPPTAPAKLAQARSPQLESSLTPTVPVEEAQPFAAQYASATPGDLRLFLQELRRKMARLAEDFAQGKLNRMQFQEIYAHYQQQRQAVEAAIVSTQGSDQWRSSVAIGTTGILRERHAARILSYATYDNATSLPLASVGAFRIDTSLLVPMLSSFRSAATEIFGAGLRSTEIEGGRWLCFVPGNFTTLMVLFSVEPARIQLTLIEDLHRDFEVANRAALSAGRGTDAAELFTRVWALDKMYPQ